MPHLQVFAACRRASIDSIDNLLSLSAIFHGISVTAPGGDLAPDALAPQDWCIGISFSRITGDEGKSFEIRAQLFFPDGTVWNGISNTIQFTASGSGNASVYRLAVFPVGQIGTLRLVLEMRESGATDWQFIQEHPITVELITAIAQPN